ncbi:MAG: hypothetical protein PVSMB4_03800 [Ktedonobacterales bacterium]
MRLEIYVASDCLTCAYAYEIAERAQGIAGLDVAVIAIEDITQPVPPNVVAVPTYLFDGQVVSLGNPACEVFLADLRQRVKEHVG